MFYFIISPTMQPKKLHIPADWESAFHTPLPFTAAASWWQCWRDGCLAKNSRIYSACNCSAPFL